VTVKARSRWSIFFDRDALVEFCNRGRRRGHVWVQSSGPAGLQRCERCTAMRWVR
jgi:hypothetical protein